ncbi:coenzyme F420-0:L-glutamate ligase [Natranaerofaba carboxydovora]|uniref:coenzyme F420-0:L-glutamate ligase n=1 Tax=Natranaerofaba carboxydovora TaxID=2742683 RepID=UPI001F1300F5|nr:coenzyme F420-0:L-glutamate ligase [Natranaerofaba carboxydovora]UMZ75010.1 F420-0:Gamma-glutamyl ligase [Natranaerofaba carboxydovora]
MVMTEIKVKGIVPIRTHIITYKDDMVDVVENYTKDIVEKGDIICVAESVLAISQGRYYTPANVRPRFMARVLSRFTDRSGSLTNPASMEIVFRDSGNIRVILGALAGGVGRFVNREGLFFQIAGPMAARIDDKARTMSPFDSYIVAGPLRTNEVATEIEKRLNVNACIADVNDLGRVDIIGVSRSLDVNKLKELLKHNPFGNDAQQTPIVIIKAENSQQ